MDLLRRIIDILLQTTINFNKLSYEQCSFLISMFDVLRAIVD
jgi:hypothetical protein